jgi:hypothetical protein
MARGRRKKTGRPTKLTQEVHEKIVSAIQLGNYGAVAARFAGIDRCTFFSWMRKGRERKGAIYVRFAKAVRDAQALAEARAIQVIAQAANENWQAAAWYLARKYPDRWGEHKRHEITGKKGGPVKTEQATVLLLPPLGEGESDGDPGEEEPHE